MTKILGLITEELSIAKENFFVTFQNGQLAIADIDESKGLFSAIGSLKQ